MARSGPPPKWGEPTSALTVRWPSSHREIYEERARELGISLSEYVIRVVAEAHGLAVRDVPTLGQQEQLPLTA